MKRVLIISYYFPPAGGSAVQRILGFVRHFPAFGWDPVVVTADVGTAFYPMLDPDLAGLVPPGTRVIRARGFEPYAVYARWAGRDVEAASSVAFASAHDPDRRERVARWIRANLFLPDARVHWSLRAGRAAARVAREIPVDAVVTSGPPQSVHLAGRRVKRHAGIPWIADFRDSWPDPNYAHLLPATRLASRVDTRLRRSLLRQASSIVAVSEHRANLLRGETDTVVTVIENGFEESDFESVPPPRRDRFELIHAGTLPVERNPIGLWKAIAKLRASGGLEGLHVSLYGSVDARVIESARSVGLDDCVTVRPAVPHAEVVGKLAAASVLLLPMPIVEGAFGIIPGKVYEYIGAGRPVIGFGPSGGETADILRTSGAGTMYDPDDFEGIAARLAALHAAWMGGGAPEGAPRSGAARYGRRSRAEQFASLLDSLVDAGAPDPSATPH